MSSVQDLRGSESGIVHMSSVQDLRGSESGIVQFRKTKSVKKQRNVQTVLSCLLVSSGSSPAVGARMTLNGALSQGSAGYEATENFMYCRPSSLLCNWISEILGHPTLKPTRMNFFPLVS